VATSTLGAFTRSMSGLVGRGLSIVVRAGDEDEDEDDEDEDDEDGAEESEDSASRGERRVWERDKVLKLAASVRMKLRMSNPRDITVGGKPRLPAERLLLSMYNEMKEREKGAQLHTAILASSALIIGGAMLAEENMEELEKGRRRKKEDRDDLVLGCMEVVLGICRWEEAEAGLARSSSAYSFPALDQVIRTRGAELLLQLVWSGATHALGHKNAARTLECATWLLRMMSMERPEDIFRVKGMRAIAHLALGGEGAAADNCNAIIDNLANLPEGHKFLWEEVGPSMFARLVGGTLGAD